MAKRPQLNDAVQAHHRPPADADETTGIQPLLHHADGAANPMPLRRSMDDLVVPVGFDALDRGHADKDGPAIELHGQAVERRVGPGRKQS